jgi:hypothetical protein
MISSWSVSSERRANSCPLSPSLPPSPRLSVPPLMSHVIIAIIAIIPSSPVYITYQICRPRQPFATFDADALTPYPIDQISTSSPKWSTACPTTLTTTNTLWIPRKISFTTWLNSPTSFRMLLYGWRHAMRIRPNAPNATRTWTASWARPVLSRPVRSTTLLLPQRKHKVPVQYYIISTLQAHLPQLSLHHGCAALQPFRYVLNSPGSADPSVPLTTFLLLKPSNRSGVTLVDFGWCAPDCGCWHKDV